MNYYIDILKNKYAAFDGRASRKEYWMFTLFSFIAIFVLALLGSLIHFNFLYVIYELAILVPAIAVTARRLHDSGKSGWWMLLALIPFIGGLIVIIFLVLESQPGDNQYGPNPYGATVARPGVNPYIILVCCLFAGVIVTVLLSAIGLLSILNQASHNQLPVPSTTTTSIYSR